MLNSLKGFPHKLTPKHPLIHISHKTSHSQADSQKAYRLRAVYSLRQIISTTNHDFYSSALFCPLEELLHPVGSSTDMNGSVTFLHLGKICWSGNDPRQLSSLSKNTGKKLSTGGTQLKKDHRLVLIETGGKNNGKKCI